MNDLTKEELETMHHDLRLAMSKIFWDFADKYSGDTRPNGHKALLVIQSVLSESQANIEYQSGNMTPFTKKQLDYIIDQIWLKNE